MSKPKKQKIDQRIKCDICGKIGFKDKSGLAGHKKISHGAQPRKIIPDEIGERLEAIEKQLVSTINPKKLETEEQVRTALELFLAIAKKYDLALAPMGRQLPGTWGKREWVVKKTGG